MVKVLIFGTGGVGICYAYVCHKAGAEVTVVCRSNYDAVKSDGLILESQLWGLVKFAPQRVVRSVAEPAAADAYDYILVCTKAFPNTAGLIEDAVSKDTAIVSAKASVM